MHGSSCALIDLHCIPHGAFDMALARAPEIGQGLFSFIKIHMRAYSIIPISYGIEEIRKKYEEF